MDTATPVGSMASMVKYSRWLTTQVSDSVHYSMRTRLFETIHHERFFVGFRLLPHQRQAPWLRDRRPATQSMSGFLLGLTSPRMNFSTSSSRDLFFLGLPSSKMSMVELALEEPRGREGAV